MGRDGEAECPFPGVPPGASPSRGSLAARPEPEDGGAGRARAPGANADAGAGPLGLRAAPAEPAALPAPCVCGARCPARVGLPVCVWSPLPTRRPVCGEAPRVFRLPTAGGPSAPGSAEGRVLGEVLGSLGLGRRGAWDAPSSGRGNPLQRRRLDPVGPGAGREEWVRAMGRGAAHRLCALLAEGLGEEELGPGSGAEDVLWPPEQPRWLWAPEPGMVETEELARLRRLTLQLLRQLWAGQDAVRHLVAQAALESSLDSSSSYNSKASLSPETSSSSSRACSPPDAQQADPSDVASLGRVSSRVTSLPPARCQHQASLGQPRARSAPLLPITDSRDPEPSAGQGDLGSQEAQAPRSILAQPSKVSKPQSTVTFCEDSEVPESSWRLRPYLGYDWIAGSLDSSSPVSSKPEAFFATLQKFREANKRECTSSHSEPGFLGLHESNGVDGDHECVYCYRVSRRLFLVPSDPGTPCRLCGTPREQRGPETLLEPAQVRVSVPLSILDPPHRYRIRRRKSFDASDTLSLPRHCLLGWDILPPRSEKGSAPKSLDLWSSVFTTAQHRKLSAASPSRLALPAQGPAPAPIWSHPRRPQPHAARQKQP